MTRDLDGRFLALIDDLIEMHPAGCGHRRAPLHAAVRHPYDPADVNAYTATMRPNGLRFRP